MKAYVNPAETILTETISALEKAETEAFERGSHEYGAGIQFAVIWVKYAKVAIRKIDQEKKVEEQ